MLIFQAKLVSADKQLTQLKVSFATKDPIDELVLEQIKGMDGWLAFSEDKFKASVETAMADRKISVTAKGKTPSQILRGTLFSVWDTIDEKISFKDYYVREMAKIYTHYINKYLNDSD